MRIEQSYQVTRSVAQADIAQVERLIDEIHYFRYKEKRRESPAHLRDELPGWEIVEKKSEALDGVLETKADGVYQRERWTKR